MISLEYKQIFQGDIPQYEMYNVFSESLTIFNALPNACYMFHRSTDSLLKAQYHQKDIRKKVLNWLKLIAKQVQVKVKMKSYEKQQEQKKKQNKYEMKIKIRGYSKKKKNNDTARKAYLRSTWFFN